MPRYSQFRISSGQSRYTGRSLNPLARIIAFLGGLIVIGVSIFVGAIFIAGFVGLALIGGLILLCRGWWLRRKMERYARETGDLEAEYTVIREETRRQD